MKLGISLIEGSLNFKVPLSLTEFSDPALAMLVRVQRPVYDLSSYIKFPSGMEVN